MVVLATVPVPAEDPITDSPNRPASPDGVFARPPVTGQTVDRALGPRAQSSITSNRFSSTPAGIAITTATPDVTTPFCPGLPAKDLADFDRVTADGIHKQALGWNGYASEYYHGGAETLSPWNVPLGDARFMHTNPSNVEPVEGDWIVVAAQDESFPDLSFAFILFGLGLGGLLVVSRRRSWGC